MQRQTCMEGEWDKLKGEVARATPIGYALGEYISRAQLKLLKLNKGIIQKPKIKQRNNLETHKP